MKLIKLGGKYGSVIGNYAQVDDEDYEWLSKWKWHVQKGKKTFYAVRNKTIDGIYLAISMHGQLLTVTPEYPMIDHEDHNGLNNQRSNLRISNNSQNQANRKYTNPRVSKFRGVSKGYKENWRVNIAYNSKQYYGGSYKTEVEAAKAYNVLAYKYHGEYATINEIPINEKEQMEKEFRQSKTQTV